MGGWRRIFPRSDACPHPLPCGGFPSGAETYLLGGRGGEAVLEEEAALLTQVFACGARNYSFLVLVTLGRGRQRVEISGNSSPCA